MGFRGFPPEAIEFYEQLGADNSRDFWKANKARYDEHVKQPMVALTDELEPAYGRFHMFRPHNDLRFSKNRPPYKLHQGAYAESEGGAGHYVHLSADGVMAAAGYYAMGRDQLERFRSAVADDDTGPEIESLVDDLVRRKYEIGAIGELKSAPRGYPRDHPRIALLRRKGLMASKDFGAPKWIHTKNAAKRIRETWEGTADMCTWLDEHVGPSTLEPDGFF